MQEASYNGSPIRPVSEISPDAVDGPLGGSGSSGPCGDCNYPIAPNDPNPGEEFRSVCSDAYSTSCPGYIFSCAACSGCSPINSGCLGCALVTCPQVFVQCCGRDDACVECAVSP